MCATKSIGKHVGSRFSLERGLIVGGVDFYLFQLFSATSVLDYTTNTFTSINFYRDPW